MPAFLLCRLAQHTCPECFRLCRPGKAFVWLIGPSREGDVACRRLLEDICCWTSIFPEWSRDVSVSPFGRACLSAFGLQQYDRFV